MVAAPLMNEADCLARQLRRNRVANYLDLTRSAYRESGLVQRPNPDAAQCEKPTLKSGVVLDMTAYATVREWAQGTI
jgi:hypothetical protein